MLLIALFFSIIYIAVMYKVMDISIELDKLEVTTEENIKATTEIKSKIPLYLPIVKIENEEMSYIVKSYQGHVFSFWRELKLQEEIVPYIRGIYDFGRLNITLIDPLGIIKMKFKTHHKSILKVYVKRDTNLEVKKSHHKIPEINKNEGNNFNSMDELKELREYRQGDSLKRVHWRLLCKRQELYVKEYECNQGKSEILILDMNKKIMDIDPTGRKEEELIEFAFNYILKKVREGYSINLFINNKSSKNLFIYDYLGMKLLEEYFLTNFSFGDVDINDYLLNADINSSVTTPIIVVPFYEDIDISRIEKKYYIEECLFYTFSKYNKDNIINI
ncbi:DUF58 domain-containing protein [Clostridium sp. 'White wine YQ']|nr:DUF58 domain-containing protein [Clostridium sp. 'White wine YQ']